MIGAARVSLHMVAVVYSQRRTAADVPVNAGLCCGLEVSPTARRAVGESARAAARHAVVFVCVYRTTRGQGNVRRTSRKRWRRVKLARQDRISLGAAYS